MRRAWPLVALVLLVVAVYAPTLGYGLVYDDAHWMPVRVGGWQTWSRAPWLVAEWLGGGSPWAYHAFVVALHLVNGALLWILARRWVSAAGAGMALLLFWLHPMQVAAVAYVSGGWEVLLTTYVLLTLLAGVSRRWSWAAVGLIAAVTLKPSARPLLAVVPVALLWATGERWALALAAGALAIGGAVLGAVVVQVHDLREWALMLGHMALAVVVPRGLSIEHDWTPWLARAPWLVMAGIWIGALSYHGRTQWPAPWWAWAWIVGLLLPRVLIAAAPPLTEHQLYLPLIALWLLAGSAVDRWRGVWGG